MSVAVFRTRQGPEGRLKLASGDTMLSEAFRLHVEGDTEDAQALSIARQLGIALRQEGSTHTEVLIQDARGQQLARMPV